MHFKVIPSILERHDAELKSVFNDILDGIKIYHNNQKYVVGSLAISEGVAPYKVINSSPHDDDYKILCKSALLVVSQITDKPLSLTVGFPNSTYQSNRDAAVEFLNGKHELTHDVFSLNKNTTNSVSVDVESVEVIPEIIGNGYAVRYGQQRANNILNSNDSAFIVNLGYGTMEASIMTNEGIVERSLISKRGLYYAIENSMKELTKSQNLGFRSSYKFDSNFQKGFIVANRKKIDLTDVRKNALSTYYNEVISPSIRNSWSDADFENVGNMILTGGGAHYSEMVDLFKDEFGDFLNITVVDEPHLSVAKGYCLRSLRRSSSNRTAVGIDIGNSQTIVSVHEEPEAEENKEENIT